MLHYNRTTGTKSSDAKQISDEIIVRDSIRKSVGKKVKGSVNRKELRAPLDGTELGSATSKYS